MRVDPMKTIRIDQEIGDLDQSSHCGIPADPSSFYRDDSTHDTEARSANCSCIRTKCRPAEVGLIPGFIDIIPIMFCMYGIASFQCQPAYGMSSVPEETEGLFLYSFQELFIAHSFNHTDYRNSIRSVAIGAGLLFLCKHDYATKSQ